MPGRSATQAVILVGGEGTRLRPITSTVPKPVTPLVERPFVAYILDNLARHGVPRAIFSSGYLAETIEREIGDGAAYGISVSYCVENEPLGTAGAIANCLHHLDDAPFLVFNGDVLSDVDLTAFMAMHAAKGGLATIFLTPVDDPRRYGVAEVRSDGSIASFLEKPSDWEGEALINAGVYVLEPEVLDMVPRGQLFSIERGVFPKLAQAGSLYGYVDKGYWRDIGTPESYLEAQFDVLTRTIVTTVGDSIGRGYLYLAPSAQIDLSARVIPPCYVAEGAKIGPGALVGPLAVLGAGAEVGEGAQVSESVVQAGCTVGPQAQLAYTIMVRGSSVGAGSILRASVLGEGVSIGAGNELARGICIWPGTSLPDGSVRFSEQFGAREG